MDLIICPFHQWFESCTSHDGYENGDYILLDDGMGARITNLSISQRSEYNANARIFVLCIWFDRCFVICEQIWINLMEFVVGRIMGQPFMPGHQAQFNTGPMDHTTRAHNGPYYYYQSPSATSGPMNHTTRAHWQPVGLLGPGLDGWAKVSG